MDLSNCILCGKMFRQDGRNSKACLDCHPEHERKLRAVKDVILSHAGLTVQEVSEKSGASYKLIMEWIKEGRIIR
ncbi:hypothetical protein GE107_25755 [Cohnella sp. CFH 77786]|uniref:hypothetical protein n=1 Tax=Cohnella sp. CFH 77786 TaxID=2662265 RepID=UPI001C60C027|nr:hypothetical protein [Cohnella sp. CFH 77786]MBW5449437.1 hypothetical protein [Cohnella sp. CFH 77786]